MLEDFSLALALIAEMRRCLRIGERGYVLAGRHVVVVPGALGSAGGFRPGAARAARWRAARLLPVMLQPEG
jgi:hypothetical protein